MLFFFNLRYVVEIKYEVVLKWWSWWLLMKSDLGRCFLFAFSCLYHWFLFSFYWYNLSFKDVTIHMFNVCLLLSWDNVRNMWKSKQQFQFSITKSQFNATYRLNHSHTKIRWNFNIAGWFWRYSAPQNWNIIVVDPLTAHNLYWFYCLLQCVVNKLSREGFCLQPLYLLIVY